MRSNLEAVLRQTHLGQAEQATGTTRCEHSDVKSRLAQQNCPIHQFLGATRRLSNGVAKIGKSSVRHGCRRLVACRFLDKT